MARGAERGASPLLPEVDGEYAGRGEAVLHTRHKHDNLDKHETPEVPPSGLATHRSGAYFYALTRAILRIYVLICVASSKPVLRPSLY